MKNIKSKFLVTIILLFSISILNAQVQIGADINGTSAGDELGTSIDLSEDGNIIAIGAPGNDANGTDSGQVQVYQLQNDSWIQLGLDLGGAFTGDQSGKIISLSSDGSIIAIGAPNNDGNGTDSGHVRVYQFQTNNWVQLGSDIEGELAGDGFGSSVSLSSDGSIMAIGAPFNNGNGEDSGGVRMYQYQTDSWVQLGSDIDGELAGDEFGSSISLSSDGSIVAAGAPFNDGNGADSGHVRAYQYQTDSWVQLGIEIDGESAEDKSGSSIRLSSNGNLIVIGAPHNDGNGTDSGHVREYEYQFDTWVQTGSDVDGESAGDGFGSSISSSSDDKVFVIGASSNDLNGIASGYSRVYQDSYFPDWHYNCYPVYDYWGYYLYDDCFWEYYSSYTTDNWQHILDIEGESEGDESGSSISISSDGNIVAISAPFNDGAGVDSGHVRIYDISTVLSTDNFDFSQLKVYPNPAKDIITINSKQAINNITIHNIMGQKVKSYKSLTNNQIDVSTYPSGFYIMNARINGTTQSIKFLKE